MRFKFAPATAWTLSERSGANQRNQDIVLPCRVGLEGGGALCVNWAFIAAFTRNASWRSLNPPRAMTSPTTRRRMRLSSTLLPRFTERTPPTNERDFG